MRITQISVFLENKKGRLYDVCSLLGDNNINIMAFTLAEAEDFGILRVVVDKPDDAIKILKEKGFAANLTDVIIVEVPDKPGGMASVLAVLNDNDVNIEYIHTFVRSNSERAFVVFRFTDPDSAIQVLKDNNITIITKDTMLDL